MYLIAIAWFYVVLMMAVAEAMSTQGTVLGAIVTFVLYGLLPVALLMYILGTPGRRRTRKAAEAAELAQLRAASGVDVALESTGSPGAATVADTDGARPPTAESLAPDGSGVAPGAEVTPVRKEA